MTDPRVEEVLKHLATPRPWAELDKERRAGVLVLSFIGYCARPSGIPEATLEKAIEAFNNNRGKVENEEKAVYEAIKEMP